MIYLASSKSVPNLINMRKSSDLCDPNSWINWITELDCFWQNPNEQWWYTGKVGHARNTDEWDAWNADEMVRFEDKIDDFYMHYFYDNKHAKVCTVDGDLSISKVTVDTLVTNCSQPVASYNKLYSDLRHYDAYTATYATAINFAAIYDDKTRQSQDAATAAGHSDWMYGDYVNYDHLPAKSTYSSNCNGHGGDKLPTVAILAIDHKGPVWSYCTTSRSTSSDNDRKSVAKMTAYCKAGEYGRAIFENLDCLLAGSIKFGMVETFTDYITGFKNLVHLHTEARTICNDEETILEDYLDQVSLDPYGSNGNTDYWDNLLKDADDDSTPLFC